MLKIHCSREESLPCELVELILEKLPVKCLLRFKSVCTTWKSTIESRKFQERQLIHRSQSRGPDVLIVWLDYHGRGPDTNPQRIVLGSSTVCTVRFPISGRSFCHGSCDGLLCFYNLNSQNHNIVLNPATRWHRSFPISNHQELLNEMYKRFVYYPIPKLGFGKDKFKNVYKPVWLYNSYEFGQDNVTFCEVFDFDTNSWRYIVPSSPNPVNGYHKPVYLDGSLYWFTNCKEPKVLSLDLHTETFQVISKVPFDCDSGYIAPFDHLSDSRHIAMCILDNRLCVSEKKWPNQVIWSLDCSGTWKKMWSMDLTKTFPWLGEPYCALLPVAIMEKNKLLLQVDAVVNGSVKPLVIHDLNTKSYDILYNPTKPVGPIDYFQSLLSILSK